MATNNIINSNSTVIAATSGTRFGNGVSTLNYYDELQSFTPVFTFNTVGNLSVVYTTQVGLYTRVGDYCYVSVHLKFTPTYTTSASSAQVTGFPFTAATTVGTTVGYFLPISNNITYPAGRIRTQSRMSGGVSIISLQADGSLVSATNFSVTQFTTGNTYEFYVFITVLV